MNFIFDFDGTIADSLDGFIELANPILRLLRKKEITRAEVREKGPLKLIKERNISRIFIPFLLVYVRVKLSKLIPRLKPFDGLNEIIRELAKKHKLGIITSNSEKNVRVFLNNSGLSEHFDFVYSSINYFDKSARIKGALDKHNLSPKETYFVGDETRDIKAAKLSGIKTVAVTWGTESVKLIKQSSPDIIVNKPSQLLEINLIRN